MTQLKQSYALPNFTEVHSTIATGTRTYNFADSQDEFISVQSPFPSFEALLAYVADMIQKHAQSSVSNLEIQIIFDVLCRDRSRACLSQPLCLNTDSTRAFMMLQHFTFEKPLLSALNPRSTSPWSVKGKISLASENTLGSTCAKHRVSIAC